MSSPKKPRKNWTFPHTLNPIKILGPLDILMNINNLNSTVSIIATYFNGKSSKGYSFDTCDNIAKELDIIRSTGIALIIDKPTHITNLSPSSIYLIFTSNPSIIVDSGIKKSLYSSCRRDVIYGKIKFWLPLPPQDLRTIWNYKNANIGSIQRAIKNSWQYKFESETVNGKVKVLCEALIYFVILSLINHQSLVTNNPHEWNLKCLLLSRNIRK